MAPKIAGLEPGQRHLNGPQTTGRDYRNLSVPAFEMTSDLDVAVPLRDGVELLVDVHRPAEPGRYPVLVAASPYPRQIQDLGAPMGFIEAGASDFFVPRGYVHVIANLRGTGGSGGTFGMFNGQERQDLYDLIEWAAVEPWSDGNVGMIGISYFAMTQLEAAVEQPPHLRAIMPIAVSPDLFEAASHHGLISSSFLTPFLAMLGLTADKSDRLWRSRLVGAFRHVLETPRVHAKFSEMNGEASIAAMKALLRLPHHSDPWDDYWRDAAVIHALRDEWWDDRNLLPLLHRVTIPAYLGCDWENVPLHLPGTFTTLEALTASPVVRVALLGEFGLTWPWESLHIEALAWYDHWLKARETGILEGPPIRYVLPGEGKWHTSDQWPPAQTSLSEWMLQADGTLRGANARAPEASRNFMVLGAGLNRERRSETDPPAALEWTSEVLETPLDMVGNAELVLSASATAADTAWIVTLSDVDTSGSAEPITAGYLRASMRAVNEEASRLGAPRLDCRTAEALPIGTRIEYRIPLVPNARRLITGHRLRLSIGSEDQSDITPAIMGFRHATVGTSSVNTVFANSRLLLPVMTTDQ